MDGCGRHGLEGDEIVNQDIAKNKERLLLSVIIPVYNTEQYLRRCVDSVLLQDYQELEVILVDDGSTDGSYAICTEYAYRDKRVKAIHQSNNGQCVARYTGLSASSGQLITFVDSDDWVDKDIYAPFISHFKKCPETDICIGTLVRDYADGHRDVIFEPSTPCLFDREAAIEAMFECKLFRWEMPGKIYRRHILEKWHPISGVTVMEDFLCNWYFFRQARQIYYENNEAYHYFYNEASVTSKGAIYWAEAQINVLKVFLQSSSYNLGMQGKDFLHRHLENNILLFFEKHLLNGSSLKIAWEKTRQIAKCLVDSSALVQRECVQKIFEDVFGDVMDVESQLVQLCESKGGEVYLYGAGKLAKLSAAIMQGMGVKLSGCIISDGQNKLQDTIAGMPIYFLSEALVHKEDLIILTTAAYYDQEIMPALVKRGLVNIVPLTRRRR